MANDELYSRRLTWSEARTLGGERFELIPDESRPERVAVTVESVALKDGNARLVQFSLVFLGPADPVFAQKTYRFRHARLGDYAFLITPVGRDAQGTRYEACFSHEA